MQTNKTFHFVSFNYICHYFYSELEGVFLETVKEERGLLGKDLEDSISVVILSEVL